MKAHQARAGTDAHQNRLSFLSLQMKPMNLLKPFVLSTGLGVLASSAHATNILLIDLSGSMKHDQKDQRALTVDEQVLPELVKTGPTAIWSFGGRCRTLRASSEPGKDLHALQQTLGGLGKPNGHTPLSWAIRNALTTLKNSPKNKPRNLIIISDGNDTCGEDPCLVAGQEGAQQAQITFYVVGVGMTTRDKDFKVLQCAAGEGTPNSVAVTAKPANLKSVMEKIAGQIQRRTEPAQQENSTLLVVVNDARGQPARVRFTARHESGQVFQGESGSVLQIPPGRYTLAGNLPHTPEIALAPGARKQVTLDLPLGHLKTSTQCGDHLTFNVLDAQGQVIGTGNANDSELDLAPGEYSIMLKGYPDLEPKPVSVQANQSQAVDLGSFGAVTVSAKDASGNSLPLPLAFYDDRDPRGGSAPPVIRGETGRILRLPAGTYNVYVADESTPSSSLRGSENLTVQGCQEQKIDLHQAAALMVCGDSGSVVLYHDESGDQLTGSVNIPIGVEPGVVYNVKLPDDQILFNQKMHEGLNQIRCATENSMTTGL